LSSWDRLIAAIADATAASTAATNAATESLSAQIAQSLGADQSKITVGASAPSNPTLGDLWVDTN
jgi:hypothetical protein